MKLENAKITILIDRDGTRIQLHDDVSGITFAEINLTPEQLSSALSRLSYTHCEIQLSGLDNIGKKCEISKHEFELPENYKHNYNDDYSDLTKLAEKTIPEGWKSDNYFGSKSSFFERNGKKYARVTIRRYV